MRMILLCSAVLVSAASAGTAAPNLSDKPKWEYAEMTFRNLPGRPGGFDADGKEVPATPASVSIRWISGAGEVEVKGWDELAEKLKAPALKKGTAAYQKIQILNYLGNEGWELMEEHTTTVSVGLGRNPGAPGGGAGQGGGGRGGAAGFPSLGLSPGMSSWLLKRRVP